MPQLITQCIPLDIYIVQYNFFVLQIQYDLKDYEIKMSLGKNDLKKM